MTFLIKNCIFSGCMNSNKNIIRTSSWMLGLALLTSSPLAWSSGMQSPLTFASEQTPPQSPRGEGDFDPNSYLTPPQPEKTKRRPINSDKSRKAGNTYDYSDLIKVELKEGDLIYGLNDYRERTIEGLQSQSTHQKKPAYTIDHFNNKLIGFLNDPSQPQLYLPDLSSLSEESTERFHRYQDYLSHHHYFQNPKARQKPENSEDLALKRACKAAIEFTFNLNSAAPSERHTLHFILDGLEEEGALDPMKSNRNYSQFTSTELRFLFKLSILHPEILKNVRFYRYGKKLESPPWRNSDGTLNPLWKTYWEAREKRAETRLNQS
ncbi:MAG: hypothetical protein ACO3A2_11155 [Bdellovibrionia bacterium]